RRNIYEANLLSYKHVAEMVHNREWKWLRDWIDKFLELSQVSVPMFTDNRDKVLWKRNNGNFKGSTQNHKEGFLLWWSANLMMPVPLFQFSVQVRMQLLWALVLERNRKCNQGGMYPWATLCL
ncbi:hypothetical protein Tco_0533449, partial [Tanacetum coccineum]